MPKSATRAVAVAMLAHSGGWGQAAGSTPQSRCISRGSLLGALGRLRSTSQYLPWGYGSRPIAFCARLVSSCSYPPPWRLHPASAQTQANDSAVKSPSDVGWPISTPTAARTSDSGKNGPQSAAPDDAGVAVGEDVGVGVRPHQSSLKGKLAVPGIARQNYQ
jgi:hypothetical protein